MDIPLSRPQAAGTPVPMFYKTITRTVYSLSWSRNQQALQRERRVDGVFPLLCTDSSLEPKAALQAYKYQPRLEKRFTQLRGVHNAAPLLFKKIERVESLMFVFFLALILQAVIERTVRLSMKTTKIDNLAIYPEHRLAYHPTTAVIFDRFEQLSTYTILEDGAPQSSLRDNLNDIHQEVLRMLAISEADYWP